MDAKPYAMLERLGRGQEPSAGEREGGPRRGLPLARSLASQTTRDTPPSMLIAQPVR